jgi:NAD-dependent deacetylase sirtuin 4
MSAGDAALDGMVRFLEGRRLVALTGAGCSTESGIPDYRSGGRAGPRNPIQHDAYLRKAEVRRRYWARATLGWSRFSAARPNAAHVALAALERAGPLAGIITQNVDRLHQAAGSRRVVELHGALAEVRCLACGGLEPRARVHGRMLAGNPGWLDRLADDPRLAPDGDAELPAEAVDEFRVAPCLDCGGVLKPEVVFFGGTVAEATLDAASALFDEAQALLVIGSSLAVYSGFRFVRRADERGIPVAVINLGPTRADDQTRVRISARAGDVLPEIARRLARDAAVPPDAETSPARGRRAINQ